MPSIALPADPEIEKAAQLQAQRDFMDWRLRNQPLWSAWQEKNSGIDPKTEEWWKQNVPGYSVTSPPTSGAITIPEGQMLPGAIIPQVESLDVPTQPPMDSSAPPATSPGVDAIKQLLGQTNGLAQQTYKFGVGGYGLNGGEDAQITLGVNWADML